MTINAHNKVKAIKEKITAMTIVRKDFFLNAKAKRKTGSKVNNPATTRITTKFVSIFLKIRVEHFKTF